MLMSKKFEVLQSQFFCPPDVVVHIREVELKFQFFFNTYDRLQRYTL